SSRCSSRPLPPLPPRLVLRSMSSRRRFLRCRRRYERVAPPRMSPSSSLLLYKGGAFDWYDGKPAPCAIEATVRNLRDVSPTWYFNVPKGFEALLPYLQRDPGLRQSFFRDLKVLW